MSKEYESGIAQTVEDPICGMEIDPSEAEFSLEQEGVLYYFCSEDCMNEFKEEQETAWD